MLHMLLMHDVDTRSSYLGIIGATIQCWYASLFTLRGFPFKWNSTLHLLLKNLTVTQLGWKIFDCVLLHVELSAVSKMFSKAHKYYQWRMLVWSPHVGEKLKRLNHKTEELLQMEKGRAEIYYFPKYMESSCGFWCVNILHPLCMYVEDG